MADSFNVAGPLRAHAERAPDVAALKFPAADYRTDAPRWDAYTFGQLDHHSDAYARGLSAAGVQPGDRTLLLFRPSLDFYAVIFGLFKVGAVPVLLDPGMGLRAVLSCIERTRPRVVIAAPIVHLVRLLRRRPFATAEILVTAGRRFGWGGHTLRQLHTEADEPFAIVDRHATDDAAILFTSGSTGPAKGVASTQAMFAAQVAALQKMFDFQPGQVDQQAFAAFAIFDISLGMTSVIPKMDLSKPATAAPADLLACLVANEPDTAFASPIVWQNLSRHIVTHDAHLPGLRTVLTVGAPIPAYLLRRLAERLPDDAEIHTPYGATEAMPISWIGSELILAETWDETARGAGTCVGHLAPGAWVRVIGITDEPIDRWSDELALPTSEIGEIVVAGDQVSPAYRDAPGANERAKIADGDRVIHRMGDLGYLDEQGRIWFCGRKSHRLQTAQGLVPPVPVEGIYNEDPAVFRTALVGVGPSGAEVPVLCVELEPGEAWSDELDQRVRQRAKGTPYEGVVQRILVHESFPVDARHNSKIRREDLKGWATARCSDLVTQEGA
ncbi:MAG: AMP-binding protein [Myxococcales bacterium]|nr:AMP-binding protein [Myxococcales bacterium]